MLAQNLEQWVQTIENRGIALGKAEGKMEGEAKGKVEGKCDLLSKQIRLKFGAMPDWAQARLDHASPEQIDAWGERILNANSLEALLAG